MRAIASSFNRFSTLNKWRQAIALCGAEVYEGVLDNEATIRAFLLHAVDVTKEIAAKSSFSARQFCYLARGFGAWLTSSPKFFLRENFKIRLKWSCVLVAYLTHDCRRYRRRARQKSCNRIQWRENWARDFKTALAHLGIRSVCSRAR